MVYLPNKYTRWYYNVVNMAKTRVLPAAVYTEKHHIIPESFYIKRLRKGPAGWLDGDPNSEENIVILTAREHFVCHLLLTKMCEGVAKSKMWQALSRFLNGNSKNLKRDFKITARVYHMVREECAKISVEITRRTHLGRKRSEETKQRLSVANKGKKRTEEQNKKNSEAHLKSNYVVSKETREKISKANLGREVKPETREKIRAALKDKPGKKASEETKAKMSASHKARDRSGIPGRPQSAESRAKISATLKGKTVSAETGEKIRQAKLGKKMSAETRAKLSEMRRGKKRKPLSEETKRKIGEANRLRDIEKKRLRDEALKD